MQLSSCHNYSCQVAIFHHSLVWPPNLLFDLNTHEQHSWQFGLTTAGICAVYWKAESRRTSCFSASSWDCNCSTEAGFSISILFSTGSIMVWYRCWWEPCSAGAAPDAAAAVTRADAISSSRCKGGNTTVQAATPRSDQVLIKPGAITSTGNNWFNQPSAGEHSAGMRCVEQT